MRSIPLTTVFLATVFVNGVQAQQKTAFVDMSKAFGVLFQHRDSNGAGSMGGGVAFMDFDADGDEDLFVTSSDGQHALFEHKGKMFANVTAGSGLIGTLVPNTMGVIVGDYNQDGRPDIYLTNRGPNQLFTNLGKGRFRDDSVALGVRGDEWSTSAAWADFDRDGDLDLYVGNYVDTQNFPYHVGTANRLYINVGSAKSPRFVDMAKQLGVADTGVFRKAVPGFPYPTGHPRISAGAPTAGCTLSVCTNDYDEDGDQDVMVGNDFGRFVLPNRLYRNDTPRGGPLKFTDVSVATGFSAREHYNMGIVGADYDHDGDWDFYMTNLGPNILLQNRAGRFVDVVTAAGPVEGWSARGGRLFLTSWGSVFADFDNDSWEDLFVVNGYIPAAPFLRNDPAARNHLWMNRGDGTFARVKAALAGVEDPGAGRGVAASDVDGDGRMDFYVMNNGGQGTPTDRCRLFVNQGTLGVGNHWSELRLHGWRSNREAIGARLEATLGGQRLKRQVLADPVYQSSSTRMVHFGLGRRREIDKLTIDWPSGIHQELVGLPADRLFHVREPQVTMPVARAPAWTGRHMRFSVRLENQTNRSIDTEVVWFLHHGQSGRVVAILQQRARLAPQKVVDVHVDVPLPAAAHAALRGVKIEQRVYTACSCGVDSRRRVDILQ